MHSCVHLVAFRAKTLTDSICVPNRNRQDVLSRPFAPGVTESIEETDDRIALNTVRECGQSFAEGLKEVRRGVAGTRTAADSSRITKGQVSRNSAVER